MGVKPGIPDLHLPVARRGFVGLYVEMKRADGVPSDVSATQRKMIDWLRAYRHFVGVAYGAEAAWKLIEWYMIGDPTITVGVDTTGNMP
jgi:hypothetical protein